LRFDFGKWHKIHSKIYTNFLKLQWREGWSTQTHKEWFFHRFTFYRF